MAVRLLDVARLAGVSVKTVSNVVNNHPHISTVTRDKVSAAIDELGYRPNVSARQLKHGRGGFITLALPSLTRPQYSQLAALIGEEAERVGHLLLLAVTGGMHSAERLALEGTRTHVVDGVIMLQLEVSGDEIAARRQTFPLVLLGEAPAPFGYDQVIIDSRAAARAMTEHLLGLGRRRIGVIRSAGPDASNSLRLAGHLGALRAAGIDPVHELDVLVGGHERADGCAGMQLLLEANPRPDAVFCFNDVLAVGALRACSEAGVRVPDQIAVAGFDNIIDASWTSPSLTTIAPDLRQLAHEAVRLVMEQIKDGRSGGTRVEVDWQLIVRESTAGVARG